MRVVSFPTVARRSHRVALLPPTDSLVSGWLRSTVARARAPGRKRGDRLSGIHLNPSGGAARLTPQSIAFCSRRSISNAEVMMAIASVQANRSISMPVEESDTITESGHADEA